MHPRGDGDAAAPEPSASAGFERPVTPTGLDHEMRALDAEGRVIDHLIYRAEQAALAQVLPAGSLPLPYEVTESITAALRSHKSFTVLGLKGIAEGKEHAKQIITFLMTPCGATIRLLTWDWS